MCVRSFFTASEEEGKRDGRPKHQFVTGTKLTLDQFEDHYNETFTSLEGFFSKSLVIDDPEHKGMLHR